LLHVERFLVLFVPIAAVLAAFTRPWSTRFALENWLFVVVVSAVFALFVLYARAELLPGQTRRRWLRERREAARRAQQDRECAGRRAPERERG